MTAQTSTIWQNLSNDWITWAERLAPAAEKINRHMIEAADLKGLSEKRDGASLDVLDLASGVGEPAFSFARALGGGTQENRININGLRGTVTATDIVPDMCDALTERAGEQEISNIKALPANMENLPFDNQSFDVVSCRFGVMFCDNPDLALREALRVLRPGGKAVFMVWAPLVDNPLFAAMDAVLGNILGIGFDAAGLDPFGFGDVDHATDRFKNAGFSDVTDTNHSPAGRIPETAPFWKPQMDMLFGNILRKSSDMEVGAINAAMFETLTPYIEDGHFQVPICFHVLSGTRT